MLNDTVSDFLTRIRNSLMVKKTVIKILYSNLIYNILYVMKINGYINNFDKIKEDNKYYILIYLKYNSTGNSYINGIKRISKPGLKIYFKSRNLKRKTLKLGILIISTNKGLMCNKQAIKNGLGGEIICNIW